jgi:NADPH-dependent ferric siderophore reductase
MTTEGAAMAQRLGAIAVDAEVVEVNQPTPSVRRVRFSGPGLEHMAPQPGQDIMLSLGPRRRRYSVRAYDPAAPWLEVDFVLHGDGPAARWAAAAEVGMPLEIIGPRGKVMVEPEAAWHLFAGDETFLPATHSMVGSLAAGMPALVVLEVDGPEDAQDFETRAALDGPHWLVRSGAEPGVPDLLVEALRALELPPGPGHAYLAGELRVVSALRRTLLERGLSPEAISPKPYWRKGQANQDHGEPQRD